MKRIQDFIRTLFIYDDFDYTGRRLDSWLWVMGATIVIFWGTCALLVVRKRMLQSLPVSDLPKVEADALQPVMPMLGLTPLKCCEGCLITGQIGSGKTSLIKRIEYEMALTGCGILHMSVKPDEPDNARRILTKANRSWIEFTPGKTKWNPLVEEVFRPGGSPESMAQLLETMREIMHPAANGGEEAFWGIARTEAATHTIGVVTISFGRQATIDHCYDFLMTAPPTLAALDTEEFQRGFCSQLLIAGQRNAQSESDRRRMAEALNYFTRTLPGAGEKVYGSTVLALAGQLAPFVRGEMWDTTTCPVSNIRASDPCRGECVIMNCPAIISPTNQQIQILFGLMCAQAALRRPVTDSTPICAIFQDEAQYVISMKEQSKYQTLARSQKLATFIGVQNLPVLYNTVAQPMRAKNECRALAGNLVTKIFMATTDHETMEWFSELTGKAWRQIAGGSQAQEKNPQDMLGIGGGQQVSWHQQLLPRKLGTALTKLFTGGPSFDYTVSGFVHSSGATFENGLPWKKFSIKQDL